MSTRIRSMSCCASARVHGKVAVINLNQIWGPRRQKVQKLEPGTFDKERALLAHQRLLGSSKDEAPALTLPWQLGRAPPPSSELRKVDLTQLQPGYTSPGREIVFVPEAISTGCCIHATIVADTGRYHNCAALVVEDENSNTCRLVLMDSVHSSTTDEQLRNMFPRGARVLVKQPLLDHSPFIGGPCMVLGNPDSLEVVSYVPHVSSGGDIDPSSLKHLGDGYLNAENFQAAAEIYTRCLDSSPDASLKLAALSSRAEAHLRLGKLMPALKDASAALEINPAHPESCSRKARALLALQQYSEACDLLERAMNLHVDESSKAEARAAYEKARVLKLQSMHGSHDLLGYAQAGFGHTQYLGEDFAEFVGPVEIKMSEQCGGRGLFVTRDVRLGELLLVGDNLLYGCGDGADSTVKAVQACRDSPRLLSQVYSMPGSGEVDEEDDEDEEEDEYEEIDEDEEDEVEEVEEDEEDGNDEEEDGKVPSLDIFRPNLGVDVAGGTPGVLDAARISKAYNDGGYQGGVGGFYFLSPLVSLINHWCLSNVTLNPIGKSIFVFAARDMKAGEEMVTCFPARYPGGCLVDGLKCESCSLVTELGLGKLAKRYLKFLELEPSERDSRLAEDVEKVLRSKAMISEEQRDWIRVAFFEAYESALSKGASSPASAFALMKALHRHLCGAFPVVLPWIHKLSQLVRDEEREMANIIIRRQCEASYGSSLVENHPEVVELIIKAL